MAGERDCAVTIIGAGPCGLMLAIELGRRGIPVIVLEEMYIESVLRAQAQACTTVSMQAGWRAVALRASTDAFESKRSASTAVRTQYCGRSSRWAPTAPAALPASRLAMT